MKPHLCPWWMAYTFDHWGRRLVQRPEKTVKRYLKSGMTAMDVGCGIGFFAIPMARIVGANGVVIAVDVQAKAVEVLMRRAEKAGVADRIRPVVCAFDDIGNHGPVDFALACFMVHETGDAERLFGQIRKNMKSDARLLVLEPKFHVPRWQFSRELVAADRAGFELLDRPRHPISHAAVFGALNEVPDA